MPHYVERHQALDEKIAGLVKNFARLVPLKKDAESWNHSRYCHSRFSGVSRHHRGAIKDPLEHHSTMVLVGSRRTFQQYHIEGFKGGPQFSSNYDEKPQPLGQPMHVFSSLI